MTLTSHFSLITIIINNKNSNYDNKSDSNTTVTTNTTTNTNNVYINKSDYSNNDNDNCYVDNDNGLSITTRNLVEENMAKRTRHFKIERKKCIDFCHHRILVKAAHVRIILLVKLGLLQKDTVVSVHKDSMERIANKVFQVSNYS